MAALSGPTIRGHLVKPRIELIPFNETSIERTRTPKVVHTNN